jgi:hypothetical protein
VLLLQHHVLLCLLTARGGAYGGQSIITCESEGSYRSFYTYVSFVGARRAGKRALLGIIGGERMASADSLYY